MSNELTADETAFLNAVVHRPTPPPPSSGSSAKPVKNNGNRTNGCPTIVSQGPVSMPPPHHYPLPVGSGAPSDGVPAPLPPPPFGGPVFSSANLGKGAPITALPFPFPPGIQPPVPPPGAMLVAAPAPLPIALHREWDERKGLVPRGFEHMFPTALTEFIDGVGPKKLGPSLPASTRQHSNASRFASPPRKAPLGRPYMDPHPGSHSMKCKAHCRSSRCTICQSESNSPKTSKKFTTAPAGRFGFPGALPPLALPQGGGYLVPTQLGNAPQQLWQQLFQPGAPFPPGFGPTAAMLMPQLPPRRLDSRAGTLQWQEKELRNLLEGFERRERERLRRMAGLGEMDRHLALEGERQQVQAFVQWRKDAMDKVTTVTEEPWEDILASMRRVPPRDEDRLAHIYPISELVSRHEKERKVLVQSEWEYRKAILDSKAVHKLEASETSARKRLFFDQKFAFVFLNEDMNRVLLVDLERLSRLDLFSTFRTKTRAHQKNAPRKVSVQSSRSPSSASTGSSAVSTNLLRFHFSTRHFPRFGNTKAKVLDLTQRRQVLDGPPFPVMERTGRPSSHFGRHRMEDETQWRREMMQGWARVAQLAANDDPEVDWVLDSIRTIQRWWRPLGLIRKERRDRFAWEHQEMVEALALGLLEQAEWARFLPELTGAAAQKLQRAWRCHVAREKYNRKRLEVFRFEGGCSAPPPKLPPKSRSSRAKGGPLTSDPSAWASSASGVASSPQPPPEPSEPSLGLLLTFANAPTGSKIPLYPPPPPPPTLPVAPTTSSAYYATATSQQPDQRHHSRGVATLGGRTTMHSPVARMGGNLAFLNMDYAQYLTAPSDTAQAFT